MLSLKMKKILRFLWVCFLLGCIAYYVQHAQYFTKEKIAALLVEYKEGALFLYFLVCVLRGLFLIPSTPFLFAGMILFHNNPLLLLVVFLISIFVVSTLLYYASGYLGFAQYFERVYPEKIRKLKQQLDSKRGSWFLFLWALAPITPTDLACYAAGALRIRFIYFIIPVLLGEGVICSIYILTGNLL